MREAAEAPASAFPGNGQQRGKRHDVRLRRGAWAHLAVSWIGEVRGVSRWGFHAWLRRPVTRYCHRREGQGERSRLRRPPCLARRARRRAVLRAAPYRTADAPECNEGAAKATREAEGGRRTNGHRRQHPRTRLRGRPTARTGSGWPTSPGSGPPGRILCGGRAGSVVPQGRRLVHEGGPRRREGHGCADDGGPARRQGRRAVASFGPGFAIHQRAVPASAPRQLHHLLDGPARRCPGQLGEGELLLFAETRTDRAQGLPQVNGIGQAAQDRATATRRDGPCGSFTSRAFVRSYL